MLFRDMTCIATCGTRVVHVLRTQLQWTISFPQVQVFLQQTNPVGRGLYKNTEVRYFSVYTKQARKIKSLLYGIYRHLYKKCMIWNAY
jgi:hypothetical protein